MAANEENLTHEEVWDDSALVNSWNDALEEYKNYHSIHSKGGNVDQLLNPKKSSATSGAGEGVSVPELASPSAAEASTEAELNGNEDIQHREPSAAARSAFIPAPLLSSVHDENLKKLIMSWYYAGYYTGYYEGQREQPRQS